MKPHIKATLFSSIRTSIGVILSITGLAYLSLIEQTLTYILLKPEAFFTNKMLFVLLVFFAINGLIAWYWLTIGIRFLFEGIGELYTQLKERRG